MELCSERLAGPNAPHLARGTDVMGLKEGRGFGNVPVGKLMARHWNWGC